MARRDAMIGCAVGVVAASVVGLDGRVRASEPVDASRAEQCASFMDLGTFSAPTVVAGNITVSGSADLYVFELNGLGIVGGNSDTLIDTGEFIRIDFDGFDAVGVSCFVALVGNGDADAFAGECLIEAFNPAGASLGSVLINGGTIFDVSALFGDTKLSAFEIHPRDGDYIRVGSVCYEFAPDGCHGDLDGDGDTDVLDFAVFLLDFNCGT